jgi:hypothetical protein
VDTLADNLMPGKKGMRGPDNVELLAVVEGQIEDVYRRFNSSDTPSWPVPSG